MLISLVHFISAWVCVCRERERMGERELCILVVLYWNPIYWTQQAYLKPEPPIASFLSSRSHKQSDVNLHSPAGIWTPLAVATAIELPLTIQHWLEIAALESCHQAIVGTCLVPTEKRITFMNQRSMVHKWMPSQDPICHGHMFLHWPRFLTNYPIFI